MRCAWLASWLAGAAVVFGCVVGRYEEGTAIDWSRIEAIQPGVTTRREILEWFGAPENFTNASALSEFLREQGLSPETTASYPYSDILAYQFHHGRMRALFLLLYNRVNVTIESDLLVVFLDSEGVVQHVGYRRIPGDEAKADGEPRADDEPKAE
jgi:hypothetical protein